MRGWEFFLDDKLIKWCCLVLLGGGGVIGFAFFAFTTDFRAKINLHESEGAKGTKKKTLTRTLKV